MKTRALFLLLGLSMLLLPACSGETVSPNEASPEEDAAIEYVFCGSEQMGGDDFFTLPQLGSPYPTGEDTQRSGAAATQTLEVLGQGYQLQYERSYWQPGLSTEVDRYNMMRSSSGSYDKYTTVVASFRVDTGALTSFTDPAPTSDFASRGEQQAVSEEDYRALAEKVLSSYLVPSEYRVVCKTRQVLSSEGSVRSLTYDGFCPEPQEECDSAEIEYVFRYTRYFGKLETADSASVNLTAEGGVHSIDLSEIGQMSEFSSLKVDSEKLSETAVDFLKEHFGGMNQTELVSCEANRIVLMRTTEGDPVFYVELSSVARSTEDEGVEVSTSNGLYFQEGKLAE